MTNTQIPDPPRNEIRELNDDIFGPPSNQAPPFRWPWGTWLALAVVAAIWFAIAYRLGYRAGLRDGRASVPTPRVFSPVGVGAGIPEGSTVTKIEPVCYIQWAAADGSRVKTIGAWTSTGVVIDYDASGPKP